MTIGCLWLGWQAEETRSQRAAVAAIETAGGTVMYDWHESGPRTISTAGRPSGPAWLRKLIGDDYFQRPVWISFLSSATNEGWVSAISQVPTTKHLLAPSNINDSMLALLAPLPKLEELQIGGSAISDQGFQHLSKFPRLRWLNASRTKISDRGLLALESLPLEELSLRGTAVSDGGVPSLTRMTHLKSLDIRATEITEQGAQSIRRALPACQVRR